MTHPALARLPAILHPPVKILCDFTHADPSSASCGTGEGLLGRNERLMHKEADKENAPVSCDLKNCLNTQQSLWFGWKLAQSKSGAPQRSCRGPVAAE